MVSFITLSNKLVFACLLSIKTGDAAAITKVIDLQSFESKDYHCSKVEPVCASGITFLNECVARRNIIDDTTTIVNGACKYLFTKLSNGIMQKNDDSRYKDDDGVRKLRGRPSSRQLISCSKEKKVKIHRFCINGDADAGAKGEHQIRLNGNPYFPSTSSSGCAQSTEGFCDWREGQCHNLDGAEFVKVDADKSIDVGTEELDDFSENDSTMAYLSSNDWYNPTCEHYEVTFSRDFQSEQERSICWTVGGEAGSDAVTVNAGIEDCTNWIEPAESYIWFMTVEPYVVTLTNQFYIYNEAMGKVLDVSNGECTDGTNIWLWSVNGSDAQKFYFGPNGSIINVKCQKAIDVTMSDCNSGTNIQLWTPNDSDAQNFYMQPNDGTIINAACNKVIDIYNSESVDGTNIQLWDNYGSSNQQWQIIYV